MINTMVSGFEGDGSISAVLCGDSKIEADLVIVGIGIIPNVELAEAAGLECNNGIVVDDLCRTLDPDIYAAGDCTNHPNPLIDRRLRLESVPNAMEQARVACTNMLGGDKVYALIPWFWSDQYELKLQMAGFSADGDSFIVRGDRAVNCPREFMVYKQLYGKEINPADLANPEFELKTLLR